jgi:2-polyprenyl-3-methyl-5-hydroxy-6-metoxy-1,4-benzoquinol methylase
MVKLSENCIICDNHPEGIDFVSNGEVRFVRCPECSLIWRIFPEQDPTNYDDSSYFEGGYEKKRRRRINKSLEQLSYIEKFIDRKENLLEIGCSVGYFLEAAGLKGWHPVGTDISEYAVNRCNEQGYEAYCKDLSELIETGETYQVVALKHVFEHFPDPVDKVNEFKKLLKPGGLLVINVPNGKYYKARLLKGNYKKFFSAAQGGYQHYFYYNHNNLADLMQKQGFKTLMINTPLNNLLDRVSLSKEIFSVFQINNPSPER